MQQQQQQQKEVRQMIREKLTTRPTKVEDNYPKICHVVCGKTNAMFDLVVSPATTSVTTCESVQGPRHPLRLLFQVVSLAFLLFT